MAQRIRILLLIPHLGGGGAEQVMAVLARGLSREKYEVHLGLVTQAAVEPGAVPPWVTVHALGAARVRSGAGRLLRLVWRLRPGVILSGIAHLNFLALLLKPLFPPRTRLLVRQNGTASSALAYGGLPWYTRLLYRALYRHADRVICQSRAMAADLADVLGTGGDLITVLPNPLDLAAIQAAGKEPSHWIGPGPHLLAVGRLSAEKGFDLLLEAMPTVRAHFASARLTILGAGPEEAALKAACENLHIASCVRFAGHVKNPFAYYPGSTLFVLCSRHEGMPNALLEALAGGLPVVATPASGGVIDLLRQSPRSWVASEVSAAALAETLLKALSQLPAEARSGLGAAPSGTGGWIGQTKPESIREISHAQLTP
jgi:glycosyltransferase involved in cell wall biosynthesis